MITTISWGWLTGLYYIEDVLIRLNDALSNLTYLTFYLKLNNSVCTYSYWV